MRVSLPYIHEYRDKTGMVRRYFRKRGLPSVPLPGRPGSPEFLLAYHAALAACKVEVRSKRAAAGTVTAAIDAYFMHHSFRALAPGTQQQRRAILDRFRREHGDKHLLGLQKAHVAKILSTRKPHAARSWLKALRALMQFVVEVGLCLDDPTTGIAPAKLPPGGFHSWTEDEIERYEAAHAIGTRARLAVALLLYTGQRRSDVIRMGPQHVRDGVLTLRQQKTGVSLLIPVHPNLAAAIEDAEVGHLAFLVARGGKPFSPAGFSNLFRAWCDAAGLPRRCSPHGLRKAACRRLAEIGCSAPEIAAISGHRSLREVQRYIEAADQAKLAQAAITRLTRRSDAT